jgi:AbiA family abortive infection protein
MNYSKTQFGHFVNFALWQDSLTLLDFQVKQKQKNRHFNTLSMFYYEKIDTSCISCNAEKYFETKVATSLFYGLRKEFFVLPYVIPKPGLGLRDYKFLSYSMRCIYYMIGLYLLKMSQEFLTETYEKIITISSFYGGNLSYKANKLTITPQNVYYRDFHKKFKSAVQLVTSLEKENHFILRLDIENYFNEISISRLLDFLYRFIKPSNQANLNYDGFTREQIICFFQFLSGGKNGIPQGENNIISSFIGHLYLVFGDLFLDDLLAEFKLEIDSHKYLNKIAFRFGCYGETVWTNYVGKQFC